MSVFQIYFNLGLDHILDKDGLDHIIFILVLCALYSINDWKKLLILVTAFTIGHSITLALATLDIIKVNTDVVELLIPVTILITAVTNIASSDTRQRSGKYKINYFLALFFGLIHGMGFSNVLRSLLGKDETIITQLLAFNIGLEVGQLVIVAIFLVSLLVVVNIFGASKRDMRLILSSAGAGIALLLIFENKLLF